MGQGGGLREEGSLPWPKGAGAVPEPRCQLCLGGWNRGTGGTLNQRSPSVHLGNATKAGCQTLPGSTAGPGPWPGQTGKPEGTGSNREHLQSVPCARGNPSQTSAGKSP